MCVSFIEGSDEMIDSNHDLWLFLSFDDANSMEQLV